MYRLVRNLPKKLLTGFQICKNVENKRVDLQDIYNAGVIVSFELNSGSGETQAWGWWILPLPKNRLYRLAGAKGLI